MTDCTELDKEMSPVSGGNDCAFGSVAQEWEIARKKPLFQGDSVPMG